MKALRGKQRRVLECIAESISRNGYAPSVRELGQAAGLRSPSTVHSHLAALEALGYIRRSPGVTRSITLTGLAAAPAGVPILGRVAAGEPILAVEDAIGFLGYAPEQPGEHFALIIRGESMRDAGILDGDLVVAHRQPSAENGDIVIALLEDEATCKRLSRRNGQVWLLPENEDFQPIDGRGARILGKVTAVVRQYK